MITQIGPIATVNLTLLSNTNLAHGTDTLHRPYRSFQLEKLISLLFNSGDVQFLELFN